MEYVGLLVSQMGSAYGIQKILGEKSLIIQGAIIIIACIFCTMLFSYIRTINVCTPLQESVKKNNNFWLSVIAGIFVLFAYILLISKGRLLTMFIGMTDSIIMPLSVIIGCVSFIGYWFGRIFISIC